jgi:hypothetical protein
LINYVLGTEGMRTGRLWFGGGGPDKVNGRIGHGRSFLRRN